MTNQLGKALPVKGDPTCTHVEDIAFDSRDRLIGRCRKCPRVVDYSLLQSMKHLNREYPNKIPMVRKSI